MANWTPYDDGESKSFTAVAASPVSGGNLYRTGSYTAAASSTQNYDYTQIRVSALASGQFCAGLALYDVASGTSNEVALWRRGMTLARADGNVGAATAVAAAHANADNTPVVGPPTAGRNGDDIIGRALTEASSGQYLYVLLNI